MSRQTPSCALAGTAATIMTIKENAITIIENFVLRIEINCKFDEQATMRNN
jgi:hypothetical protein